MSCGHRTYACVRVCVCVCVCVCVWMRLSIMWMIERRVWWNCAEKSAREVTDSATYQQECLVTRSLSLRDPVLPTATVSRDRGCDMSLAMMTISGMHVVASPNPNPHDAIPIHNDGWYIGHTHTLNPYCVGPLTLTPNPHLTRITNPNPNLTLVTAHTHIPRQTTFKRVKEVIRPLTPSPCG